MDNVTLISTFVESVITHKSVLLANAELRIEPAGHNLQLWSKQDGLLSSAPLLAATPGFTLRVASRHSPAVHDALTAQHYLPTNLETPNGFDQYEAATIPQGYQLHCKDGLLFLQAWWQYQTQDQQASILGMLFWHNRTWHPIRRIECNHGALNLSTWGGQIVLQPHHRAVWLLKEPSPYGLENGKQADGSNGQEKTEKETAETAPARPKYIGNYLVEAGLLSTAQVGVILSDQAATGMRFGDIVASRGWLKSQTIEYLMTHLILPQRQTMPPAQARPAPAPPAEPRRKEPVAASIHDRETLVVSLPFDDELRHYG